MATKKKPKEVKAEKVTQGGGKALHTVIMPDGKKLKLDDAEFEKFLKKS